MDCLPGVTNCKHLANALRARCANSHQPKRYALRARYANSHQPKRYAHAARTAISYQPSAISHQLLVISHQPSA
ncbi:MAG: hypothetical protein F6K26_21960 [Moorea sp. SIO2I5]|nr:hypothetical protein [Moorena sp. SIO2I5]